MSDTEILNELVDQESRERWGRFSAIYALFYLGLQVNGMGAVPNAPQRIASARAAKAKGVKLWEWARDNPADY
ncbi:hypothetical protein HC761_00520 [bacterium]|nr:hypothetical protein [bacterium]